MIGTEAHDGPAPDGERRSAPVGLVVLVVALVLLGGVVGYVVGVRTSDRETSAVDVGFLSDMSDHHDQAVTMALIALSRSEDPVVLGFAQDVVVFQRSELGTMAAYLADQGSVRAEYDPDRTAMAWMDMPVALASMPGLASEEDLQRLRSAEGAELDELFLELMADHHEGGIHMAEYAAGNAADPRVRTLAGTMARNQAIEVREYQAQLERMGVAVAPTDDHDMADMGH